MRVAVLGCSGAMGSFFAKYFLGEGNEVTGYDVRGATGSPIGVTFAKSNADAVGRAELVIAAVPTPKTAQVIRQVLPFIPRGSMVVEIASVKGDVPDGLRRTLASRKVSLLSIHPLFGPLARMKGSKICVIGGRHDLSIARSLFPKARLLPMGATDHDRLMAFAISLVHLMNMAIISVLAKSTSVKEFERVAPPISAAQLNLGRAVLSQDPSMLVHIQVDNPFVVEALSSIIAELNDLSRSVERKDVAGLQKRVATLAGKFPRDELDGALKGIYSSLGDPASGNAIIG